MEVHKPLRTRMTWLSALKGTRRGRVETSPSAPGRVGLRHALVDDLAKRFLYSEKLMDEEGKPRGDKFSWQSRRSATFSGAPMHPRSAFAGALNV